MYVFRTEATPKNTPHVLIRTCLYCTCRTACARISPAHYLHFPRPTAIKRQPFFFSSPDAEGVNGRCLPRAASDAVRFLFFSDSADRQYQDYRSRRVFGDHLRVSRHLGGGTKDAVPFSPTFTPREKCPVYFFSGSRNSLDNTYRVCCAKQPRRETGTRRSV